MSTSDTSSLLPKDSRSMDMDTFAGSSGEKERMGEVGVMMGSPWSGTWMRSSSSSIFSFWASSLCASSAWRKHETNFHACQLMFANFSDLIEDPDKVRQIYQCHGHTLTNTIITPSHSFIYTIESHPRPAFRCRERNQKVLFSENLVNWSSEKSWVRRYTEYSLSFVRVFVGQR